MSSLFSEPTSPNHALQRTAPAVTLAASGLRLSATVQPARQSPQSLSLGSLDRHPVPTSFETLIFYPDGKEPEVSHIDPATLSPKWSAICTDILAKRGPVFKHNMGSTLAHFEIEMAGPVGRLLVHNTRCFDFWITRAPQSEQDRATIRHFAQFLHTAWEASGAPLTTATLESLERLGSRNGLIFFDYCRPEIEPDQKAGIAQLGFHLAHSYFEYSKEAA